MNAHVLLIGRHTWSKVESRYKDEITQNEDAPTVVIALGLDVGVCHQEYGKNDDDGVPTRKHKGECIADLPHLLWRIPRRESNHSWNLKKADLQGIRRTDFHAQCNVGI